MGILDVVESAAGTVANVVTEAGPIARRVPIAGELLSGAQALYHTGAAVYDGVTGDRDGAVNHGTQALVNAVGMIPGVPETYGAIELAAAAGGTVARASAESDTDLGVLGPALGGLPYVAGRLAHEAGIPTEDIPGGIDDLAGSLAVAGTNAIFGADDSNWIADGTTPQGTRGGEVGAGLGTITGPVTAVLGAIAGEALGSDEPTSGAQPGTAAQYGQAFHDVITGADLNEPRKERSRRPKMTEAERTRPRAPGDPVNGGVARVDEMARSMSEPVVPGKPSSSLNSLAITRNREDKISDLAQRANVPMERLANIGPDGQWHFDEARINEAEARARERGR